MLITDHSRKLLALAAILVSTLVLYFLWARPAQLRWGATDDEVQRPMPGDELNPAPDFLGTRAITIAAPPERIWPWLLQMGFTRAGFYGFDLFQAAGTAPGPLGVNRILPQFQEWSVGDVVPVSPVDSMVFQAIQPLEFMVWRRPDGTASYTWALHPIDGTNTRLVVRTRWDYRWTQPGLLPVDVLTEFSDHVAIRKVLEGIRGRVEGDIRPRSDLNVEMFLYLGALAVFIWTLISVWRLPLTPISWLVGMFGGGAWLITWYGPASLWLGTALSLIAVWAVRYEYRERKRARLLAEASKSAQERRQGR